LALLHPAGPVLPCAPGPRAHAKPWQLLKDVVLFAVCRVMVAITYMLAYYFG
jgi:hypothetical protein